MSPVARVIALMLSIIVVSSPDWWNRLTADAVNFDDTDRRGIGCEAQHVLWQFATYHGMVRCLRGEGVGTGTATGGWLDRALASVGTPPRLTTSRTCAGILQVSIVGAPDVVPTEALPTIIAVEATLGS